MPVQSTSTLCASRCKRRAKMLLLTLAAMAAVASAKPSYIAVPADQIAFVDLRNLVRVPRQILTPPPPPPQLPQGLYNQDFQLIPIEQIQESARPNGLLPQEPQQARLISHQQPQQEHQDSSALQSYRPAHVANERPPDFGEFVDFGAHTGDHGAFGWYADYPISNHDDSYRK